MTDIFFSYKSVDRDRVSVIHDVLTAEGFDVFWDQEVEAGIDWDTWIRNHLTQAKCVVVFWSKHSIESDNVRHEATVAKRQNKLIHVLLDPITPEQFPMGLYTVQAANLGGARTQHSKATYMAPCLPCPKTLAKVQEAQGLQGPHPRTARDEALGFLGQEQGTQEALAPTPQAQDCAVRAQTRPS